MVSSRAQYRVHFFICLPEESDEMEGVGIKKLLGERKIFRKRS